jgi:hypothetical protein
MYITPSDLAKRAKKVLDALSDYDAQKAALAHWDYFVQYSPPTMTADIGEVAYVESTYLILRQFVVEWQYEQRYQDLLARIAALEEQMGLTDRS